MSITNEQLALVLYRHPVWDEWFHADSFGNTVELDLLGSGIDRENWDYIASELQGDPHPDFRYIVSYDGQRIIAKYRHTERRFYQYHEIFARGDL